MKNCFVSRGLTYTKTQKHQQKGAMEVFAFIHCAEFIIKPFIQGEL